jgi:secreted Zn-dependent insulinase-like peptidase
MNSKFQYFHIEKNNNDNRDMRGIILDNGIKIALISDKNVVKSCCSVGIGTGSLHDSFEGIAHFLEHLLFMGNEKYKNQNDYHSYVKNSGGYDNAYTADEETCYFLILESKFLKKGIEMLSWFFRAPLLQECHINSERNIVNSEHEKNILSDVWIKDNLSKYFYKENSKYRKFSTGNNESLKVVTNDDIRDFYKKYYTTDNMFICIIDSKDLNYMENNYVPFFEQIIKTNHQKEKLDKIEYNNNDLIIYKSIGNYNILDIRIVLNCDKFNKENKSIANFLLFILSTKFTKSLSYYLLEEKLVYDINVDINMLYEKYCVLILELNFENGNNKDITNKIKKSLDIVNEYLIAIENITEKEFFILYENYVNIVKLNSYFNKNKDVSDIAIDVTNNLINSKNKEDLKKAVIENEFREEYNKKIYKEFINILESKKIKLITNLNILNIDDNKFLKSKWYDSYYNINFISNFYEFDKKNIDIKKIKNKYDFKKLIDGNIHDADNLLNQFKNEKKIKNNSVPNLIYSENKIKRKIYLITGNNYDSPSSAISIIRKNHNYDKKSQIIFLIYYEIINKILIYYLEKESLYLTNFNIKYNDDELIYNFKGIFNIDVFTKKILNNIGYENIIRNKYFNEYFKLSINIFSQILENEKYNSPFLICQKYLDINLKNEMNQEEVTKFVKSLSIDIFKEKLKKLLEYEEENIIIFANTIIKTDDFISKINDSIKVNNELIIKHDLIKEHFNYNKSSYIVPKLFITPNEMNNCLLDFYKLKQLNFKYTDKNILDKNSLFEFVKYSLIADFIVDLLTDKLFDKLRTIEKLGYIVRVSKSQIFKNDKLLIGFYYLVQSTFSISRINDSINEFNNETIKNINFKKNFENLKENKLILLNKDFETFDQEAKFVVENVSLYIQNYDIKNIFIKICQEITYSQIIKIIKNINLLENTKIIVDIKNNK